MLWAIVAVVIGILLTVASADKFVDGAGSLASRFGMSHFLIGLTIISIGTSAPELLVSTVAAYQGAPGLALGNALGSNITNIALVLGVTACVSPLIVPRSLVKCELPILVFVCLMVYALAYRGEFDRIAGAGFLITLPVILVLLAKNQSSTDKTLQAPKFPFFQSMTLTLSSLALLIGSSKALVWGATEIARYLGVSELIIGLTIVAIGTSLPELAASIASAVKNQTDMALGTIIGSNFFNFLGVIGLASVISPFAIEPEVFSRDLPWNAGLHVLLLIFASFILSGTVTRSYGILLVLLYVGYLSHIFATIVTH